MFPLHLTYRANSVIPAPFEKKAGKASALAAAIGALAGKGLGGLARGGFVTPALLAGLGGGALLYGLSNSIPFISAGLSKHYKDETALSAASKMGMGFEGLGLGGTVMPIVGHIGGGIGGFHLGNHLVAKHNQSMENELALAELAQEAKELKEKEEAEKSASSLGIMKRGSLLGTLVGALHPEMSAAGGFLRGSGIAAGGSFGALGGGALGALLGSGAALAMDKDTALGAQLGAALGGIPGAILGGRLGWKKAKNILKEHAQTSLDNKARSAGLDEQEE